MCLRHNPIRSLIAALMLPVCLLASVVRAENKIGLYNEEGPLKTVKGGKALNATPEKDWEYWQLSETEWKHYLEIKAKSPWAVWENHSTPLAMLAFYANSSEEKQRYARIEAELDQWREAAVMEWQALYNREREIVFARTKIELDKKQPLLKNMGPNDRVLFFVGKGECSTRCIAMLNPLMASAAHIDVYVIGATTEAEIFTWAKSSRIPPERVHLKQITLNYEAGIFNEISPIPAALADLPAAYWHKADGYVRVIL